MSASEQLQRLLYILPTAARGGGATLPELARALGCDARTILRDLEEATARDFYKPPGSVDPFSILIEDERVTVVAPEEFNRPPRLTRQEALALSLGLRMLAAEAESERRAGILELAERLERELAVPDIALQPMLHALPEAAPAPPAEQFEIGLAEDEMRGALAEAIEQRRYCRITYAKPGEPAPSERRIAPHALIYANGRWYVTADDEPPGQPRLFRLDRIVRSSMTAEQFDHPPPTLAETVEQRGFAYIGDEEEVEVTVRYSARISHWIAERMPATREADGTALVTHRVSDPGWLVRHVLQYAGEAVVETPGLRRAVADAAARLSA